VVVLKSHVCIRAATVLSYEAMRHDGDITGEQERTNGDGTLRLTVPEAAGVMGISAEAVRQRIKRGTLPTEKDASGTVHVLLNEAQVGDRTRHVGDRTRKDGGSTPDSTALVESLREQVEYLKETVAMRDEEIRRRDHLLAAALERIPAIEGPQEATGSSETASEDAPYGTSRQEAEDSLQGRSERQGSWWRKFFGLE
jgi:hypothetical protein